LDAGAPSTQAWLTASQRMRPQDAKRDLTLASLIRNAAGSTNQTDPDGDATDADDVGADGVEGAEVRAGLVAGDLSVDQAGCVATALGELPTDATVSTRVLAERLLVDEASLHGPAALTRLGHRILERVDPEAADRRLANCLDREEREARRLRAATRYCDGHGSVFYKLRVPIGEDAHIWPVLDTLAAPDPADEASGRDLRLPQQRLADAFVEAFRRVGLDGGLPSAGGDRPRALVTIGLQQLRDGLGHGQLVDTGDQLSPTAMRILCCDAQIIPAVLGGAGQVLDLGRARRTFDGPIRLAVIGRDGGCIHPGCTRPARWCDVHHVISWWAGGDTSLDTVSCCAGSIIGSTTSAPGRSGSPPTGSPSRYHPPGSTPRNDPDATNASTNEDPALAECPRYTLRLTGALSAWRPR
jgi:hypothetical protein